MIELPRQTTDSTSAVIIKILGLGGGGSNALDRIVLDGFDAGEIVALNADVQALTSSVAPIKVQLGRNTTRGLGAGGDPEVGYAAAEESEEEIKSAIANADMIFLVAGLGGGTGSGCAPLVASYARAQDSLVVAFVTMPFSFEGRRRRAQAEEALESLQHYADVVICFENDKLSDVVSPRAGIQEAFAAADHTISQSVRAIAALVNRPGLVRVGFDELQTALRVQNPRCLFGYGEAEGDNRAHAALERALRSPLMERGRLLEDARNLLVNIVGGPNLTLNEVQILMEELHRHIGDETRLLFGTAVDPRLGNRMAVMLLGAIGSDAPRRAAAAPPAAQPEPAAAAPDPAPIAAPAREQLPKPVVQILDYDPAPVAAEPEPEPEPEVIAASEPAHAVEPAPAHVAARATPAKHPVRANSGAAAAADAAAKREREAKQEQLTFEPITRGRFEKSEPTIVDGEDLDVPAFMRRNVRVK
jgi:cell division protein FtsZ